MNIGREVTVRESRYDSNDAFIRYIHDKKVSPHNSEYFIFAKQMITRYYHEQKNDSIEYILACRLNSAIRSGRVMNEEAVERFLYRSNAGSKIKRNA